MFVMSCTCGESSPCDDAFAVHEDSLLRQQSVRLPHLGEGTRHPVLDTAVRQNGRAEVHHLVLGGDHREYVDLVVGTSNELQRRDVVKHLQAPGR